MFVLVPLLYVTGLLSLLQVDVARVWSLYAALLIVSTSLIVSLLPLMKANRVRATPQPAGARSRFPRVAGQTGVSPLVGESWRVLPASSRTLAASATE